uniref:Putative serine protease pcp-1 (inferred by orthology to a C. elegans protein) n=1 Tax=Anisakis simplex TaxID=6269 RepID=A0A0M3IZ85_ANISI
LYNLTYYEQGGPIFFYTGNEGSIEGFAENTGIMWDLAKQFKAAIVFAEHRYYGTSMPFGNLSYTNVKYLGYLASTQALADYAKLIPYLKEKIIHCPPDTPVISFGGSYGGMLSAWFRMKYPDIVTGAWASSAPLMYFPGGGVDPGAFDHKVKEDFLNAGCNERTITNGFAAIMSLSETASGRQYLNDLFHIEQKSLLTKPEDGGYLIGWINEAIVYMAMVDYPYPSNFLEPLPGWPINYVCKKFAAKEVTDEKKAAKVMYEISNVYYNFTGAMKTSCVNYNKCGDTAMANLGSALGWPWQTCTELVIAMCSEGPPNDFFSDDCKAYGGPVNSQYMFCNNEFGSMGWSDGFLHPDSLKIQYGFNFAAASNIVFTNGDVDPWSPGGVYERAPGIAHATKHGVYTFLIAGSAHHLDLRQPNTCDPPPVRNARFQITNIIDCWVNPKKCPKPPVATKLPPLGELSSKDCKSEYFAYPWGQKVSRLSFFPTNDFAKKFAAPWSRRTIFYSFVQVGWVNYGCVYDQVAAKTPQFLGAIELGIFFSVSAVMITSMWELWLGVFVVYVGFTLAHRSAFPFDPVAKSVQQNDVNAADHPWITDHFDVPIDNFAYTSNATYSMRYLYNNTYYKKGGPIFFYAGNEGAIEGFAMNTVILSLLSTAFNANIQRMLWLKNVELKDASVLSRWQNVNRYRTMSPVKDERQSRFKSQSQ